MPIILIDSSSIIYTNTLVYRQPTVYIQVYLRISYQITVKLTIKLDINIGQVVRKLEVAATFGQCFLVVGGLVVPKSAIERELIVSLYLPVLVFNLYLYKVQQVIQSLISEIAEERQLQLLISYIVGSIILFPIGIYRMTQSTREALFLYQILIATLIFRVVCLDVVCSTYLQQLVYKNSIQKGLLIPIFSGLSRRKHVAYIGAKSIDYLRIVYLQSRLSIPPRRLYIARSKYSYTYGASSTSNSTASSTN